MEDVFVIDVEENVENNTPTPEQIQHFIELLSQLLSTPVNQDDLWNTIRSPHALLLAAVYLEPALNHEMLGVLVGTATLIEMPTPHGRVGYVHDVVVKEELKGKGIGKKLMQYIDNIAKERSFVELNLTTNPKKREEAEGLYLSLGYERKDTGFYVKKM